ncbi:MAG: hypothetical protein MUF58_06880 [Arcicella sp.]|jgi:hypothetical protein|nr:hypothetical protein [Arcicella sp.]
MAKLFIFGIGGTGSRVIKALTMLLASGVKINASEIIPIIIDPDRANGDLNRTIALLKSYQHIRTSLEFDKNQFFRTKITTLNELVASQEKTVMKSEDFRMELEGVQNQYFRDFIAFEQMDEANKALTSLLFSEENLASDMEVGFKGNPNIGSVVLNKFSKSDEFKNFASNFAENDRIFIISSIFGGTGAAGFPLILKNIRNAPDNKWLRESKVGAVSVLPYFGVTPDEKSKIDKATFISKTKAALSYYSRNITGNKSVNALYYIGDKETKDYDNREGSKEQMNAAHFVELASALAIVDFMEIQDGALKNNEGRAENTIAKEFGIESSGQDGKFNFSHIGKGNSAKLIRKPLTQAMLFHLFLEEAIDTSLKHPWANAGKIIIDSDFLTKDFYKSVREFWQKYNGWLKEMSGNTIGFSPFKTVNKDNVFHVVDGIEPKEGMLEFKKNFELFIDRLNGASVGDLPIEQKFMALFTKATEKLAADKFGF